MNSAPDSTAAEWPQPPESVPLEHTAATVDSPAALRLQITRLEEQRQIDAKRIEALQAECRSYRRWLSAWVTSQVTSEDLQRWFEQDNEAGGEEPNEPIDTSGETPDGKELA